MKKIIAIVAAVVVVLLIVGLALGYGLYLGPRMKIKSFTEDLARQVERDAKLNNDLAALSETLDWDDDDVDLEELSEEVNELKERVEAAQRDYEDILRQINALEADELTQGLKQDFVALNQFYIDEIPAFQEILDYLDKFAVAIDEFAKATEAFGSLSTTASPEQMAAEIQSMSATFKTTAKDLEKLEPPESFEDLNEDFIAILTETAGVMDETALAISTLDIVKLTEVEAKFTALETKYANLDFAESGEKFDEMMDDVGERETAVIANARQEIDAIRSKYGSRWVSPALTFEPQEGWLAGPDE